jgi:hypothetical protein
MTMSRKFRLAVAILAAGVVAVQMMFGTSAAYGGESWGAWGLSPQGETCIAPCGDTNICCLISVPPIRP